MFRTPLICPALALLVPFMGLSQTGNPAGDAEIQTLKHRVAELEEQNRAIPKCSAGGRFNQKWELTTAAVTPALTPAASTSAVAPATAAQPATAAPASPADQVVRWGDLVLGGNNKLKFYGQLRLDVDLDSQRPNSPQAPLLSCHPILDWEGSWMLATFRCTRVSQDLVLTTAVRRFRSLGDAGLSGKLELDFENGGSESREIIRIRHAYLQLKKDDVSILAGQTWDLFSPLFPTVDNDTLLWNAGNVGDRRPQFRVSYEPEATARAMVNCSGRRFNRRD